MKTNALIATLLLLITGCGKQDKPAETTAEKPAEPAKPSPKAEPAKPPAKVVDALSKVVPPMPKVAGSDFEWKLEAGDRGMTWRLKQKAAPNRVAMLLELDDLTERIKSGDGPSTPTSFAGYPASRGKEFVRLLVGNVGVQVSTYPAFPAFATDAVMEETLNALDLKTLAKL
jgi:hypothetical protein